MGAHQSAPSSIPELGIALSDLPELGNCTIPFLFKVLSIEKALSIQAHPDKKLAEVLHEKFPHIYKDDNHKPEMAIALGKFEALSGFRTLEDILNNSVEFPEFEQVVGLDAAAAFKKDPSKQSLKLAFCSMMNCDRSIQEEQQLALVERLKNKSHKTDLEELFIRLNKQYPNDIGCFSVFFFNYLNLDQFEAFFMGPNEPHAYLSGDCIECMATSDNVVRAGLTPKYKDVDTLCSMLTFEARSPKDQMLQPVSVSHSNVYSPPIDEFIVVRTVLEKDEKEELDAVDGHSILICVSGSGLLNGTLIEFGSVYFLASGTLISLVSQSNNFVVFIARSLNKT